MKLKEYVAANQPLNISRMARELGICADYMFILISGKRRPGIHLAKRIEALTKNQVTVDELMEFKKVVEFCPECGRKKIKQRKSAH